MIYIAWSLSRKIKKDRYMELTGVGSHRRLDHLFHFGQNKKTKLKPRAYHTENER